MHEADPQDKTKHLRIGRRLGKKLKRGYLILVKTLWISWAIIKAYFLAPQVL